MCLLCMVVQVKTVMMVEVMMMIMMMMVVMMMLTGQSVRYLNASPLHGDPSEDDDDGSPS